jgi:hypothetical protein
MLEPILLDAAREAGGDVRFDHEVVAVSQTAEHASAVVRVRPDGDEYEIEAKYIILRRAAGASFGGQTARGDGSARSRPEVVVDVTFAPGRFGARFLGFALDGFEWHRFSSQPLFRRSVLDVGGSASDGA